MQLQNSAKVFRKDGNRPEAKVPVLKLTHTPTNTSIDVVCNNVLGEPRAGCVHPAAPDNGVAFRPHLVRVPLACLPRLSLVASAPLDPGPRTQACTTPAFSART